ncbi:MAG: AAA family ATPase [Myxococcota bacterium]
MEPIALGWGADQGPAEVRRTHLSEVFLGRTRVWKTKRAVDLGFVDFTDPASRLAACEAEVRLNRRLAPAVYHGVVHLPNGEPAVEMTRLRDEDSLLARLERGALDVATLERVAERVARFHQQAETSDAIAALGGPDVFRQNALDNFDASTGAVGRWVHPVPFTSARAATAARFERHRELLQARASAGRVRDTHGDLRLEHVYVVDGEVVVIDCIEFSDRFRYADVALDAAFLVMDLEVRSERALAAAFWRSWVEATGDRDAEPLLPLFVSYRSAVRAKVAGFTLADPLPPERFAVQSARAKRHWLLAWSRLLPSPPVLVGIGGRPGTGKSTLARALAVRRPFVVIRSDAVRRELPPLPDADRYGAAAKGAVYDECFRRASEALFAGNSVIVDASFVQGEWRGRLRALGRDWGVPVVLLRCTAEDAVVRARIRARTGDLSEADESVYDQILWEDSGDTVVDVDLTGPVEPATDRALAAIDAT